MSNNQTTLAKWFHKNGYEPTIPFSSETLRINRYNTKLKPGCKGTVDHIDDIGTIHVAWDCGSGLGIVYGEDSCRKVVSE